MPAAPPLALGPAGPARTSSYLDQSFLIFLVCAATCSWIVANFSSCERVCAGVCVCARDHLCAYCLLSLNINKALVCLCLCVRARTGRVQVEIGWAPGAEERGGGGGHGAAAAHKDAAARQRAGRRAGPRKRTRHGHGKQSPVHCDGAGVTTGIG